MNLDMPRSRFAIFQLAAGLAVAACGGPGEIGPNSETSDSVVALLSSTQKAVCSGSIVGYNTILTAAHCFCDNQKMPTDIFYGRVVPPLGGGLREYEEVIPILSYAAMEPEFCNLDRAARRRAPDIAIVDVGQGGGYVEAAHFNLAAFGDFRGRSDFTIAGFGEMDSSHDTGTFNTASIDSVDWCREGDLGCEGPLALISRDSQGNDSCSGDSGGPLLIDGKIVGVVSRGSDAPGIGNFSCGQGTIFTSLTLPRDVNNGVIQPIDWVRSRVAELDLDWGGENEE